MNMYIKDITKKALKHALKKVNEKYDGNVVLAVCEPLNKAKKRWRVRLTVKDSHKKGARLGVCNGYHMKYACWHVHGHFFNFLPFGTVVRSALGKHTCGLSEWKDKNIGSLMYTVYLSQACTCIGGVFKSIKRQMEMQVERQKRREEERRQEEERRRKVEEDRVRYEEFKQALNDRVTDRLAHKYANSSE